MKKKIAILGSTGSIGKSLLKIINRDKKNYKIILLTAKKNYKKILEQAETYKVKNLIITDNEYFKLAKIKHGRKFKIYNNFNCFNKIFKNKIDYTMSSITGISGLEPTFKIIKYTKKIAIANKESIICGWNLIKKELDKNKTEFIPVDSEHFSIWYALKNNFSKNIEKIYLTASGGPLLNFPVRKYNKLKVKDILSHPTWKMGDKISIDSATMMNKVFEFIEAKKIFNIQYKNLSILIHPKSYLHAIVKFKDGMIKLIAHDTTMEIPILNTLKNSNHNKNFKKLNLQKLNNLNLKFIDYKKYPSAKIIKKLSNKDSLFETVIVSANDTLVDLFLRKKIKFTQISQKLLKFINQPKYILMKQLKPKNIEEIIKLNEDVRLKIKKESI